MRVLRLAALLWRRGGARQRATLALTAAGVAASTVLALLVVSVLPALGHRADRTAWHEPTLQRDAGAASALQRTSEDSYLDEVITRIDLAPVAGADGTPTPPPVPPGLARFPGPGEIYASPAMVELLRTAPALALADRFPGELHGTIGEAGIAHDDELVVVVGRNEGALDALPAGEAGAPQAAELVMPINAFATSTAVSSSPRPDDDAATYRALAQMAAVLLVVPTVLLIGAAARLTAAQREQRLAALRLAGATPATVIGLTAIEVAGAALAGALVGIGAYVVLLPVAAQIPLGGGVFRVSDLRLTAGALAVAAVVAPVLAVATAVVALRGVVGGPLQSTRRVQPRRPRAVRFLVLPVAWGLFVVTASSMRDGGSITGVLVGLGAVIVTLSVIGPWLAWLIGAILGLLARRPSTLIAARRITDDPKATYRTVSGMVLAGLIAGFLFGVLPTINRVSLPSGEVPRLYVAIPASDAEAVSAALDRADPATIAMWDSFSGPDGGAPEPGRIPEPSATDPHPVRTGIVATVDPGAIEVIRTAVRSASPDAEVSSPYDFGRERILLDDLGRASTVMSLAALLMATAGAGIAGAAAILDQRVTLARLRLVGTPITVLQRARRWQTLVPLVLASGGAMAFGAVAGLVMLGAFGVATQRIEPPDVLAMALLGGAAIAAGLGVVAATRPLLVSVSRATPRD